MRTYSFIYCQIFNTYLMILRHVFASRIELNASGDDREKEKGWKEVKFSKKVYKEPTS